MQGSLFPVESNWKPPTGDFPELDGNFALDLETYDPLLGQGRGPGWAFDISPEIRGYVVGYGIGAPGFQAYYPIRHAGGGNVDVEPVLKWLRAQFQRRGKKVFHNGLYDLGWAQTDGIRCHREDFHDTQYLEALLDENQRSYSLDSCLQNRLGEQKDETLLACAARDHFGGKGGRVKVNPKKVLWQLHSKYVGPYGEQDAGGTWRLFEKIFPMAQAEGLERVYDMERSLLPIVLEMRRRGVRVDLDRAEEVRGILLQREKDTLQWIRDETGYKVREGVPSADAAAILRKFDVAIPRSAAGNDSVVASWLESLDHPVGKMIVRARKSQKAYRDFIDSGILGVQVNGRIHASFHPLMSDEGGTVTGRFSCTDPNLQQIPARDPEIGPLIRSIYVGEVGQRWGKFDYSSQEPRWTLHFANLIGAPGAAQAVRIFREDPRTDFHGMMRKIIWPNVSDAEAKTFRRKAKDIFLGMCYGMGGAKLCRTLGYPTAMWTTPKGIQVEVAGDAGREVIDKFNQMAPFVKKLADEAKKVMEKRGYVMTYLRRRCRAPEYPHKALNRIIQSTSAEQTKCGMIAVYDQFGYVPLLQVHDETGYSIEFEDQAVAISKAMEMAMPDCQVPHVCEPSIANSWGECK